MWVNVTLSPKGPVRVKLGKLRGGEGRRMESASRDTNFQALRTYGRTSWSRPGSLIRSSSDDEIRCVVRILSHRTKNNPVRIGDGESGVDKTAMVEGLVQRIVHRGVPSNLLDMRLIALNMGALMAEDKVEVEGAKDEVQAGSTAGKSLPNCLLI
jgi:ATP-dependent Clp protease ATP-binding subunit ClpB